MLPDTHVLAFLAALSTAALACGSDAGGAQCGDLGEPCCSGRVCDSGTCSGGDDGVCTDCGEPGQACCDLGTCGGDGCCVDGVCTGEGSTCPQAGGECVDGSCGDGTCGGPGQPCCNDFCTAGAVSCEGGACAQCGGPGEPCCDRGQCGPDLACGDGACRSCGGPGEPCCPGDACDDGCCDLGNDVCVAEGSLCDGGGECSGGMCVCIDEQMNCGDGCQDVTSNVDQCGDCSTQCDDREYCIASGCECRPGLVRNSSGSCIDPQSDPSACGDPPVSCGGDTPRCAGGECVADCGGLETCGNQCVDTNTDPLHCGGCDGDGEVCENDEVCVQGDCRSFDPAPGCNSCPCDSDCGGGERCCDYPGDPDLLICVDDADSCPV